jgi:hypothetical protein
MLILDKRRALERIMALMSAAPGDDALAEAVLLEGAHHDAPPDAHRPGTMGQAAAAWGIAASADSPLAAAEAATARRDRRRRRRVGPDPAPA